MGWQITINAIPTKSHRSRSYIWNWVTRINNIKDVIIVDVVGASPISITINGDNSINVGSYKLFSATVNPINSSQLVTWKSSDTSIVTVDEHGSVKGIGVGSAIITAVSVQNTNISKTFNVRDRKSVV